MCWRTVMKRIARYSVVVPAICVAAQPQTVAVKKLAIHPAEARASIELRLLPGPKDATNGDAFVLYEKAIGSLPKDLNWGKVTIWRQTPAKELPLEEVATVLRPFEASLLLLSRPAGAADASGRSSLRMRFPRISGRAAIWRCCCRSRLGIISAGATMNCACGLWGRALPWPGI